MSLNTEQCKGDWQPGTKRYIKLCTARKRRRLWKQSGEHAPRKVRELTVGYST